MSECTCDYSYTCPSCQARYDAQNAMDYANEIRDWTVESIKLIAKALNVEIPEPPREQNLLQNKRTWASTEKIARRNRKMWNRLINRARRAQGKDLINEETKD